VLSAPSTDTLPLLPSPPEIIGLPMSFLLS
jgi:hypothetical protein